MAYEIIKILDIEKVSGENAVVTGAGRGTGRAIVVALYETDYGGETIWSSVSSHR